MKYQDREVNRNWYGETKKYRYKTTKKQSSMFYEVVHWFETWVLIFLVFVISLFVYLSW
jgi:uncharacterized paraquat-inducible protein A